jgi:hypothetical protein
MVACETGHEQNSRMTEGVGGGAPDVDRSDGGRPATPPPDFL